MKKNNDQEFIENYDPSIYPRPSVAVDLIICSMIGDQLHTFLITRDEHPFKGMLSLPGGFVRVASDGSMGDSLDETAIKVLKQKVNLPETIVHLEQLYTFGTPQRDPRTRVISVAYFALIPQDLYRIIDLSSTHHKSNHNGQWVSVNHILDIGGDYRYQLAFDHQEIIKLFMSQLQQKIELSDLAFSLVSDSFTVSELRAVYEAINHTSYDASNFRRRFKRWKQDELIVEAEIKKTTGARPAKMYRRKTRS